MLSGMACWMPALGLLVACSGGGVAAVDPGGNNGGGGNGAGNASAEVLALEDQAFDLVNDERAAMSLAPLQHDDALRAVARAHSEDMVARAFFSHVNPDGDDPFDRMSAAGITFSAAAENIAWNLGYADPAGTAVVGWMNSAGHRANILNGNYLLTGMGVAIDGNGGVYFTQVFTRPTGLLVLGAWVGDRDDGVELDDMGTSSWSVQGQ